jgi:hypothetical protein
MAIVPNILDMVAGVNERKRAGRVREAMGNYLNQPEETIQQIMPDNPDYAQKLMEQRRRQQIEDEDRRRNLFKENLPYLRGVDDPEQREEVIGALQGQFESGGMTEEDIANMRSASAAPGGNIANRMDPEAWKAKVEEEYSPYYIQPGQQRMVGGEEQSRGEYAMQTVQVPRSDGGMEIIMFDRNTGTFVTEDGEPASPRQAFAARTTLQRDFDNTFGEGGMTNEERVTSTGKDGISVGPRRVVSEGRDESGRFRLATPQELRGYPQGTAAQIDTRTGQLVNIKQPPASRGGGGGTGAGPSGKPETATELKDRRAQEDKERGRKRFDNILGQLGEQYTKLRNIGGAIIDPSRGSGSNIEAWINSSSVGRVLGRIGGTEAESIRQTVDNMRPLLIQNIREVTGMSSKAMDSNTELQFYIQSATDTGKDIASNLAAIAILDRMYGSGTALDGLPADLRKVVEDRVGKLERQMPTSGLPAPRSSGAASAPSSGWGKAKVVN